MSVKNKRKPRTSKVKRRPSTKTPEAEKPADRAAASPSGADLLTIDQAIDLLKTSRPTFYRWLRSGKLKGTKAGRQWRFRRDDIERFLAGQGPRIELTADISPFVAQLEARLKSLGQTIEPGGELSELERAARLMIRLGLAMRAADIHLAPHMNEQGDHAVASLRYRVDGVLHPVAELDRSLLAPVVDQFKSMAGCDLNVRERPQDGRTMIRFQDGGELVDLRLNFLPCALGESFTARILDRSAVIPELARINYAPQDKAKILKHIESPWGLMIVTGPVGCGKTTTLYACLQHLACPEMKIMTIEDPVEFVFPWMIQVQVNEAAGMTFRTAVQAMLRSDPDVILIGELRDHSVLWIAQASALTGHLVFSTLHADEAAKALIRMVDMGSDPFLVIDTTKLIVAQRLVRKLCPHCSAPATPEPNTLRRAEEHARLGGLNWSSLDKGFRQAVGCAQCGHLGHAGRDVIAEALEVTPEIGKALERGASVDELRTIAVGQGMTTMAADGIRKAAEGVTSLDEVIRVVGLR
jgi:excisionase family DNA binding protein